MIYRLDSPMLPVICVLARLKRCATVAAIAAATVALTLVEAPVVAAWLLGQWVAYEAALLANNQ